MGVFLRVSTGRASLDGFFLDLLVGVTVVSRLWYFCVFIKRGIVTQCQPIAYPLSLSLTEEQ